MIIGADTGQKSESTLYRIISFSVNSHIFPQSVWNRQIRDRGPTLRLGGTVSDSILGGGGGGAQDTFSY